MQLTFTHDIQDTQKTFGVEFELGIVMFLFVFVEGCFNRDLVRFFEQKI